MMLMHRQHGNLGLSALVARGSSPSVARGRRTNSSVARLGFSNMESLVSQGLSHEDPAQVQVSHEDPAQAQVSLKLFEIK